MTPWSPAERETLDASYQTHRHAVKSPYPLEQLARNAASLAVAVDLVDS
jgi:hypothetical protein